jgi:di/tricarboxylate transporter
VLAVLLGAIALILSGRLRNDLTALLVLVSLALGEQVTPREAFSGFSSPAIFTLAGLFVVTAALNEAGFVQWVAEKLERLTGRSEARMVTVLILVGAALSMVINTTAAGSVLLPVAIGVARRNQVPVSKVLMPMGFGCIVGGTATIFTTANIIMSGLLQEHHLHGLAMTDFLPTGGALVLVATLYLVLCGRHLLPVGSSAENPEQISLDLTKVYELDQRLWELRVSPGSPLAGQSLAQARLQFPVLAIWTGDQARFNPGGESELRERDVLLVSCRPDLLEKAKERGLSVGRQGKLQGPEIPVVTVEVVIPPRSNVEGRTLAELNFQTRYGLTAVALWRAGRSQRTGVGATSLQAGDALLVVGEIKRILALRENPNYIVVNIPAYSPLSFLQSAWTLAVALGVVLAAGAGLISMSLAAVAGALALVLLRVLSAERAYQAIDWSVLVLIAGMAPLAGALQKSGLMTLLGHGFSAVFGGKAALAAVAGFYLLTVLVTQIVGGQVSALITGPLALSMAERLHVDLIAMAVLVGIAASNCFLTSVAHPVNALMAGSGGYRGADFVRVGVGLQLLCFTVAMLMARLYWHI